MNDKEHFLFEVLQTLTFESTKNSFSRFLLSINCSLFSKSGSRFQFVQPNRDLQSNWEVDLAKKLEEYLFKICSGEISSFRTTSSTP